MTTRALGRHRVFTVQAGSAVQRRAAWADAMRPSGTVEIAEDEAGRFTGALTSYALGEALAAKVDSDDFRLIRDAATAAGVARDRVFVNFVERGRFVGHLAGRSIRVEAGAVLVTRLGVTMDVRFEGSAWYGLLYPLSSVRRHMAWRPSLDAKIFWSGSVSAVLLGHHLRSLLELPDDLPSAKATRIAGQSLRFLLPHLGGSADEEAVEAASEDGLIHDVRRFIADRLSDPDLDADMICRVFALSRARLYRMFGNGDGIAAGIRRLRLLCAHRDIASGRSAALPLSEIAARWGMADPRTFRRAFVAQFGYAPSHLRAAARADADPGAESLTDAAAEIERWFGL